MIVPAESVIAIDSKMQLDLACLIGCAVSTGAGVVRHTANVQPGDDAIVIGCGGVGLNAIQAAKLSGANEIVAVDVSDEKLNAARNFGATVVVDPTKAEVVEAVTSVTGGLGAHDSFESAGLTSCMARVFSAIRPGGMAVLLGMAADASPFVIDNIAAAILQEKWITGPMMDSGIARRDYPRLVPECLDGSLMLKKGDPPPRHL
jgi:S-(hydroxymethyl)glutathione dehydrogenase/alcohol dehydrogenase